MSLFFDGREYAKKKEEELKKRLVKLRDHGVVPHLTSFLIGENEGSKLYLKLKRKAAERIGAILAVRKFSESVGVEELVSAINDLNENSKVNGIMVQLPLPQRFTFEDRDGMIEAIDPKKDVDGLRAKSEFVAPLVRAVWGVVKEAENTLQRPAGDRPCKVVVVGSEGFEGRKIVSYFKSVGYYVDGVDKNTVDAKSITSKADILISATGSAGIINDESQIKKGAIVIDIGSPKGDVITQNIVNKAAFISPVPGGVGPATIACLMENLVLSVAPR